MCYFSADIGQTAEDEDYDTGPMGAFPVTVTFEMDDSVGRTRCANRNVSIFSDGLAEGPEAFAVIMDFEFASYNADPAVASVAIDDEDDGKSVVLTIS